MPALAGTFNAGPRRRSRRLLPGNTGTTQMGSWQFPQYGLRFSAPVRASTLVWPAVASGHRGFVFDQLPGPRAVVRHPKRRTSAPARHRFGPLTNRLRAWGHGLEQTAGRGLLGAPASVSSTSPSAASTLMSASGSPRVFPRLTIATGICACRARCTNRSPDITDNEEPSTNRHAEPSTSSEHRCTRDRGTFSQRTRRRA